MDTGETKYSRANPKLVKRINDHTSEVAKEQTAEINAFTENIVCKELDKRFPPALIELPEDSEKAKAGIIKARKAIQQLDLQRCKDTEAAKRALEGKEPLGRRSKQMRTEASSSTTRSTVIQPIARRPKTPAQAPMPDIVEPEDVTVDNHTEPAAEQTEQAEQVEDLKPINLSPTVIESPTEEQAEELIAKDNTENVIVLNEPHMRMPVDNVQYTPQVVENARDIYPCKKHLDNEQFSAHWMLDVYTGMLRLKEHMSFHDSVNTVMQDVGKLAFPAWVLPQHSPSPEHWLKWLERVATDIDRQGLKAFKSVIMRHGMYHFPPERSVSAIQQFGLKIVDCATMVQAYGGDRSAVRKAEKLIGGSLYSFWPGIGIDLATKEWDLYITWLYEVKDLIIEDLNMTEKVLMAKGFRLAPIVW